MTLAATLLLALCFQVQEPPAPAPLAPAIAETLRRSANCHSPTPEELAEAAQLPPAADAAAAVPLLLLALQSSDVAVRTYALTLLIALQTPAAPTPPVSAPSNYKPDVARLLAPSIPQLAAHLTEESTENRALTATVLGGFTPDPPPTVFPPLYAYLRRPDAITPIGLAVVADLLSLGPISADTADSLARYLRRQDQTPDSRANLVDAIASKSNQSPALNAALLTLLDSDDASLRARVILSLPQLDLAPDVFTETKARVQTLAGNPNEALQVVSAAKAVAPCWTAVRMTSGCPVY